MSHAYTAVQWNRHKVVYDAAIGVGVLAFVGVYVGASMLVHTGNEAIGVEVLLIRGLAACALTMLHVVLCIGPLARLSPRFAPILYNRRHLGVCTFLVALAHATLATFYYGAFGGVNPVLASLAGYASPTISGFPFEVLGFLALLILFVLATTSHDFWLKNLSRRVWKTLHMSVYAAYALVVLHAALGFVQSERSLVYPAMLAIGVAIVSTLHVIAGRREASRDRQVADASNGWIDVASVDEIPESRAKVVCVNAGSNAGERVAIFKHEGKLCAVSNVCAHQGGPLGEGKIVGGCITCPWHGYQYLPGNGQSPPPFTEKVATYELRIRSNRVLLNPNAKPPGTPVEPADPSRGEEASNG